MNKVKLTALILVVVFLFVSGLQKTSEAAAKKTTKKVAAKKKAEGGQVQLKGYEGKVGAWLFNGTTRLKIVSVTYPVAGPKGETPEEEGKKWVVVKLEIKNARDFTTSYGSSIMTLVDKDGKTFQSSGMIDENNWNQYAEDEPLLPAAGMKGMCLFAVPSDYKPVRLVFQPNPGFEEQVFRVSFE